MSGLNRSPYIVEWWGGEEARPTLADVQERYAKRFVQESRHPYITILNGEPIGYAQSYVALEAGTDGGKSETDPGTRE